MTVLTEKAHPGEIILREGQGTYSRERVIILSGEGVLPPCRIIGQIQADAGTITVGNAVAAGTSGNTGTGALTKATPAYGAGVQEGTYHVLFTDEDTNLGDFIVYRPDGTIDGYGRVGTAYDGQVKFSIADSTDFKGGDAFTLAVTKADPTGVSKWRSCDPTNTDGSEVARGVLVYGVDATSADQEAVAIVRLCEVNGNLLDYDAAIDDDTKKGTARTQLAALNPPVIARF